MDEKFKSTAHGELTFKYKWIMNATLLRLWVHDSFVLWEYGFIMSYSALKPKWPNIVLAKHCSC